MSVVKPVPSNTQYCCSQIHQLRTVARVLCEIIIFGIFQSHHWWSENKNWKDNTNQADPNFLYLHLKIFLWNVLIDFLYKMTFDLFYISSNNYQLRTGAHLVEFWPLLIFPAKANWIIHRMKDHGLPIILLPNSRYFYWIIGVYKGYLSDIRNS